MPQKLARQAVFRAMHQVKNTGDKVVEVPSKTTLQYIWEEIARLININAVDQILGGSHAERLTTDPEGLAIETEWYETDRGVTYRVDESHTWVWKSGKMYAEFADRPVDLGTADAGFELFITAPYYHNCRWDGAEWAVLEQDGGMMADWPVAPSDGWQLCDGTITDILIGGPDLGESPFTTPDLVTAPSGVYYKSAAAYTGVINAPTPAGLSGNVGNTTATNNGATTGASLSLTTVDVEAGSGTTVISNVTLNDPGHNHTQNPHTHSATTIVVDTASQPRNIAIPRYVRR